MRPENLKTQIFLDSGDPVETKEILLSLGFLDGQTTNPTLVAKNPYARERFENGLRFKEAELYDFYQQVVRDISQLIPSGSVSIEVYADRNTSTEAMVQQAETFNTWIPNAHIKYPITLNGIEAAVQSLHLNMRVNMTLCFQQSQAAAIYAATQGAKRGDVFISPFVGRLDDRGENGMDLIANCMQMYESGDHHVEVLAASIRNQAHFMQALAVQVDIITAPFAVLKTWANDGMPVPKASYHYDAAQLKNIPYHAYDLNKPWQSFDVSHSLTDAGIDRFAADWNALLD